MVCVPRSSTETVSCAATKLSAAAARARKREEESMLEKGMQLHLHGRWTFYRPARDACRI